MCGLTTDTELLSPVMSSLNPSCARNKWKHSSIQRPPISEKALLFGIFLISEKVLLLRNLPDFRKSFAFRNLPDFWKSLTFRNFPDFRKSFGFRNLPDFRKSFTFRNVSDFRKSFAFRNFPRLRPFVFLVRATCRWRWMWGDGEINWPGKTKVLAEKNLSQCHFFNNKSHIDWRGLEHGLLCHLKRMYSSSLFDTGNIALEHC